MIAEIWQKTQHNCADTIETQETLLLYARTIMTKLMCIWICVQKNQVTGFIAFHKNRIAQLHVHPDNQHQGIATALVHKVKNATTGNISLNCLHKKVGGFYTKQGFIQKDFGSEYDNDGLAEMIWLRP